MPEVVRAGSDSHTGHFPTNSDPFHKTSYVSSINTKVYVDGNLVIVQGEKTACGDTAVGCSSKVFAGGLGFHRKGDVTSGHGLWVPSQAESGSAKVSAG